MAYARDWGWIALSVLFFGCTVLAILRIVFLGGLTLDAACGTRRRRAGGRSSRWSR